MLVKISKAKEIVINYSVTIKGVKEYKTLTLAEFLKLKPEERPVGRLMVLGITVEEFESGQVEIDGLTKDGYVLKGRVQYPGPKDTYKPFVIAHLDKSVANVKVDDIIDDFFA